VRTYQQASHHFAFSNSLFYRLATDLIAP
jgi:hypothetical protein